jgi:hypothetical protein
MKNLEVWNDFDLSTERNAKRGIKLVMDLSEPP